MSSSKMRHAHPEVQMKACPNAGLKTGGGNRPDIASNNERMNSSLGRQSAGLGMKHDGKHL
jgi:hypothetical protein